MAKVTGPLFSLGASGKIGDAIVFFLGKENTLSVNGLYQLIRSQKTKELFA